MIKRNLIGQKFRDLVVIGALGSDCRKAQQWVCECICGNTCITITSALTRKKMPKSHCGCRNGGRTHGATAGPEKSPTYKIWIYMKERCYRKNNKWYKLYGGRGITVCDEWKHNFPKFLEDMGERPPGLSIDRIDNDGNYCKENCRWATPKEQANNRCVRGSRQTDLTN